MYMESWRSTILPFKHTEGCSCLKNSKGGVPRTCVTLFHWSISVNTVLRDYTHGCILTMNTLDNNWALCVLCVTLSNLNTCTTDCSCTCVYVCAVCGAQPIANTTPKDSTNHTLVYIVFLLFTGQHWRLLKVTSNALYHYPISTAHYTTGDAWLQLSIDTHASVLGYNLFQVTICLPSPSQQIYNRSTTHQLKWRKQLL